MTVPFMCNAQASLLLPDFMQISIVANLNLTPQVREFQETWSNGTIQNQCSWLKQPMLGVAGWGTGCMGVGSEVVRWEWPL